MKIHFIGIGGIGTSALARLLLAEGNEISGSDVVGSTLIENLRSEGVKVSIDPSVPENIPDGTGKIIFTVAVDEDNPEIKKARELGIKIQSYPEALGEVSKNYFTLAVTGAHGKSTTTGLLALMMVKAGLDPTVIVGTMLKEFGGSNFRKGDSKYLVIEADDYNRSFLNYTPQVAIVTNVDAEHLDTYGNIDGVVKGFNEYLKQLPETSIVILNKEDKYTGSIKDGVKARIIYFESPKTPWKMQVIGGFNQLNAEAAFVAGELVGVTKEKAIESVREYKGAWRRMEKLSPKENRFGDKMFFSDYAHHPTEISATLEALKESYARKTLTVVYQPHQVRRLTELFDEFTKAFGAADQVLLLPVYKVEGRDEEDGKTSEELREALKARGLNAEFVPSVKTTLDNLTGDIVVFMGAGDIDKEVRQYFRSELL